MNNKRLLKLSGDKIYYTKTDFLPLANTNLPNNSLAFKEYQSIFWEVALKGFDKASQTLFIRVLNYEPRETATFDQQTAKFPLQKIAFDLLNWQALEPVLSYYAEADLAPFLFNHETLKPRKIQELPDPALLYIPEEDDDEEDLGDELAETAGKLVEVIPELEEVEPIAPVLVERIFKETFTYPFKETSFHLGYVLLKKRFNFYHKPLEIKIFNAEIIPEYELVKNYFPKALKCKAKFNVTAIFHLLGEEIIKIEAQSPQISAINDRVIGVVKQLQTLSIPKLLQPEIDKSLFTADEVFDPLKDEGPDANVFSQNPEDILATLLEKMDVRNAKQLAYLAERQSEKQALKFTLKPDFGFLFLLEGESCYHYCWELLDSHATYLWSFEKGSLKLLVARVEENINLIRASNRTLYKSAYRQGNLDDDLIFHVIRHEHASSDFIDGFVLWQKRFREQLV